MKKMEIGSGFEAWQSSKEKECLEPNYFWTLLVLNCMTNLNRLCTKSMLQVSVLMCTSKTNFENVA